MTHASPSTELASKAPAGAAPRRRLSLVDTTSIIIGIIIGAGLYETTPIIADNLPGPAWLIGFWVLGGAFALVGSLCYAELATAYPADGGDYVYLTRAFGRPAGFMFAWAQLWVIRPGSIGSMAYVFGDYATQLFRLGSHSLTIYAAGTVVAITAINVLGVREGKWTQNLLTAAKVLGLVTVIAIGIFYAAPTGEGPAAEAVAQPAAAPAAAEWSKLALALLLIVFTYGGWNDMAFVAAEVRDPERNIVRALLLGTAAVIAIYVGVNLALLRVLSFAGVAGREAVAAQMAEIALGEGGRKGISLLICVSTLGAINGMIFTGARIYYAMGQDHRLFARLGRWSARFDTPATSLVVQAACTLAAMVVFGALAGDGLSHKPFERLVVFTTPVFWLILLATGVSLFVLRLRDGDRPRPFRVPGYPTVPLVFCGGSALIVGSSVLHAVHERSSDALVGLALLAVGGVLAVALAAREGR
ncbi:MAG: amino acid permease [Planctomycetia bacterium]|nr:amino acid permease [Planctomycetia bacterium]